MAARTSSERIAIVTPNYYPVTCGVGDHSMRIGRALAERGIVVQLFTHQPAEPNPEAPTVRVHGGEGRTPLEVCHHLRGSIAAFEPTDLVIQYTPRMLAASRFGTLALATLAAAFRGRTRVTVVFHELVFPWSWRPDLAVGGVVQRVQFLGMVGASDRVFVTTSRRKRWLDEQLRRARLSRPVDTIYVGANALPLPRRPSRAPRIGIFSTMGPNRPLDVAVDAFALVRERYPNAELVLIGDLGGAATAALRSLKAHVAGSPAASAVRFTGRMSLAKVAEEVAALDVYLFADRAGVSTRSGTLPVAFGAGVPVVAVPGPETDDQLFADGKNLIYADEFTDRGLAAAILRLLNDQPLADRVSEGGRELYDRHLSWRAIADRLLSAD